MVEWIRNLMMKRKIKKTIDLMMSTYADACIIQAEQKKELNALALFQEVFVDGKDPTKNGQEWIFSKTVPIK
jgi:hypothetical protein